MNLAKYSLDNTKISLLLSGCAAYRWQYLSFGRLGKKEDAPFVIKSAVIMTRYPGSGAGRKWNDSSPNPSPEKYSRMSGVYKIKV